MPRLAVRDFGTALSFPGGTSSVAFTPPTLGTTTRSMFCWFKPKATTNNQNLFSLQNGLIRISPAAGQIVWFSDVNIGSIQANQSIIVGQWYSVAITQNGTTYAAYVNGSLIGTGTTNALGVGNTSNKVGSYTSGTNFIGLIDEVRYWDAVLTSAEVASLHLSGVVPQTTLQKGAYLFDEGSGTSATDSSGNGNNGTITGATYTSDVVMKPRILAINRVAVRDYKAAMSFTASTQLVSNTNPVTGFDTASSASLWFKTGSDVTTAQRIVAAAAVVTSTIVGMNIQAGILRGGYFNGTSYVSPKSTSVQPNTWYHLVVTWDGTTSHLYVNGTEILTTGNNPGLNQAVGVRVGNASSGLISNAIASDVRVWTRALSAAEVTTLYTSGTASNTSLFLAWPLTEGAGTTANDTSGNSNNGTITGATFTSDTPSKARQLVGGNLVKNGNFEYAPPFVAATTTLSRWLDGTAAGSTTNNLFGWALRNGAGTIATQFDTTSPNSGINSLKLSTLATGSWLEVVDSRLNSVPELQLNAIPVQPNRSYTLTYYMKTNYVSGDSANGAALAVVEYSGAGVGSTNVIGTQVKTTTAWTQYTITFTTAATTAWIVMTPRIHGHTGTATLIMDAWFDDIVLTPTVNTTRVVA